MMSSYEWICTLTLTRYSCFCYAAIFYSSAKKLYYAQSYTGLNRYIGCFYHGVWYFKQHITRNDVWYSQLGLICSCHAISYSHLFRAIQQRIRQDLRYPRDRLQQLCSTA